MAKIRKIWEKGSPYFWSAGVILFLFFGAKSRFDNLVTPVLVKNASTAVTISTVLFGFLLSVLTLLASLSASKAVTFLRKNGKGADLIKFNRDAVYSSGFTSVSALMFVFVDDGSATSFHHFNCFELVFPRLWVGLAVFMLVSTIRYVRLFYKILNLEEVLVSEG